jgi:hypothetical protein
MFALLASSTSAGPLKVAVVGDSISKGGFKNGHNVPEFNWPTVLGMKLDKDGNKLFDVYNGANCGSAI